MKGNVKTDGPHLSKTLTRMFLSYLIVILVSILLISLVLYQKFTAATIEDVQKNIQENLAQDMNLIELIRGQVSALGLQLMNDSDIVDAMYRYDSDELMRYKATRKLVQVRDSNPMVHSIYVYNAKADQFVSSLGSSGLNPLDGEMQAYVNKYKNTGRLKFIPLSVSYQALNKSQVTENIISLIFQDSAQGAVGAKDEESRGMDSAIIINLKAEYLQKSLAAMDYVSDTSFYLVDREGEVICDSDLSDFAKNIMSTGYISDILAEKKNTGYMIRKEDGVQYLITYNASDKLPLIFINKSGYAVLLQKVYSLRQAIILMCVLIFLVCIVISVFAAYNAYLPFGRLVKKIRWQIPAEAGGRNGRHSYNEIEYLSRAFSDIIEKSREMEVSIQENIPFLKKMFLKGLLEGNALSINHMDKRLNELEVNLNRQAGMVLLFSIDGFQKLPGIKAELTKNKVKADVEGIISGKILGCHRAEILSLDDDLVAAVINLEAADRACSRASTDEELKEIRSAVREALGLTVTVVKGLAVERLEDLHLSYSNCIELLKYRFVYGYNSMLDNDIIWDTSGISCTSVDKSKEKLIQAVKSCNTELMGEKLDEIMTTIRNDQYDYIRLTINQLALDIMQAVKPLLNGSHGINFNNIYINLNNMDTLEATKEWFLLYCSGIIEKLEAKKDIRRNEMINGVMTYLKNNYGNPGISIEMLADMVNLTPGYLGKMFTDIAGKSLNEYLIELRMNKARELLESRTSTVSEIAGVVGYSNQSYFSTVFKKYFGTTPNQYRAENNLKNDADR